MIILGINAYNGDSSACIVVDGKLVFAIEEERIRRTKHWAGFPSESVKACLIAAGVAIHDVNHIGISRDPSAHALSKIWYTLRTQPKLSTIISRLTNASKVTSVKDAIAKELGCDNEDIKAIVHNVEHHRSHLASSFFVSEFD